MVERTRYNPIQVTIKVGQKCGFVPTHLEINLKEEMDAKGATIIGNHSYLKASRVGIAV